MESSPKYRSLVLRLVMALAVILGGSAAVVSATPQAAQAACYEGRIPGSYKWISSNTSLYVVGSACTTRWGQMVWDADPACCAVRWVKIDRQENGTYGWQTTHTKMKGVLWSGQSAIWNTATVPWVQYTEQRFRSCWGVSGSINVPPTSWDSSLCTPWVN